jgi:uncharacterized coiled-coil protein SlyX
MMFPNILWGQRIVEITDSKEEYVLGFDFLEILEDTTRSLSFVDAQKNTQDWILNQEEFPFNKNPESSYWIRFKIRNTSRFDKNFILETFSPHTNLIEIYVPNDSGVYRKKQAGENFEFENREHINKNIIFDIPHNPSNTVTTVYAHVLSKNYSGFDFRIKSVNYFMYYSTNEYYFLGIYYGILIIMALYNLLIFFSVHEKVYLYYVFYVASGILSTLTDDGLGFQYVWSSFPELIPFIGLHFAPTLLMLTFALYASSFLELRRNFPKEFKIVWYSIAAYAIYYVFIALFIPSLIHFKGVYIIPFIITYGVSIRCFFRGYKPARFFIIGYTFIFVSIIIIQLRAMHIQLVDIQLVPGNIFTVYALNYGLVLEVVILSFALADRIRIIKREKEEAQKEIIERLEENKALQEKVNRELEQKVAERTRELISKNAELEDANLKLKDLNEKVNEMNAKLDYDNWHLKKDLKEDLKARIVDAEVSYEQFNNVFPDEPTCFRYMEDLKWGNGYNCRKCGNQKYTKTSKPFTRKCTKCGNVESVTAYTLFHGVRFPINKAFYMTYIVHRRGNKITLDELSELLQLRRNTCWSFKKKVMEHIDAFKKKSKDGRLETWEEIIL